MLKLRALAKTLVRSDSVVVGQKLNNNFFNNCPAVFVSLLNQYNNNKTVQYYCTESTKVVVEFSGLNKGINVEDLTNGDLEVEKKLRVLILETDVMRQEGSKIPEVSVLKVQHWAELLIKTSRSQRKKYLEFLWKIEKKRENTKVKQEQARIERESRPEYVHDGHIRYGLNHNTFLIRIYDSTINNFYNSRLITATQFGQPLVIDCGYDDHMTSRECTNCAKQIMLAFSENRNHSEPFDLHLCNTDSSKHTMRALERHIVTLYDPWFPLNVHQESYLTTKYTSLPYLSNKACRESEMPTDLKERLVYLTPHCREELKEYDHDAIYIVGGIVDKVNQEPLSLAKAKREGLRMAKLPLDRYLQWGSGSGKSLTINQMISVLLDIKHTGDWEYALRHVPRRKVLGSNASGAALGLQKNMERHAPAYDRNSKQRIAVGIGNKWDKDGRIYEKSNNRFFDNAKDSVSKKNTKNLIKDLMKN